MKAINKRLNRLRKPTTTLGSLLIVAILSLWGATGCEANESVRPENIVSFFATVSPNSYVTAFGLAMIGTEQVTSEDLNELLRPSGGKVLIVTSITGYHITPTSKAPFSVVWLLARKPKAVRGWGGGGLSISGLQTTQVNYRPGLVVTLLPDESLCIESGTQSNDTARVQVHGYLMERS